MGKDKENDEEMIRVVEDPAGNNDAPTRRRRNREPIQWCTPSWKPWAWCISFVVILIVIIILLSVSLHKLNSTEYGVQYTKYSKQLDDAAATGGLHVGPPGYKFIKFPSTYLTVDLPDAT